VVKSIQSLPKKIIEFKNLNVSYGINKIFSNFDLIIPIPKIMAFVGPSGCGKSTLLKIITKLHPYNGTLHCCFTKEQIGLLFQDDELLPWKTIYNNIALGLKFRKTPLKKISIQVENWLNRIHLMDLKDRYPSSLSGGQRKRVAIAQCLILSPTLLLLDEPFSSLDAIVRREIVDFIFDWIRLNKLSAILVTHDLDEAVSIADRIVVLSNKADIVEQVDVDIPPLKPSQRRLDPNFSFYLKKLWQAMEKSNSN
jgi:NitT/TauT family transport system ATP-binding protein